MQSKRYVLVFYTTPEDDQPIIFGIAWIWAVEGMRSRAIKNTLRQGAGVNIESEGDMPGATASGSFGGHWGKFFDEEICSLNFMWKMVLSRAHTTMSSLASVELQAERVYITPLYASCTYPLINVLTPTMIQ